MILKQLKKLSTFIIILILLFAVNIVVNVDYKWEGISLIVRIYLFIFSFFFVYIFALIDLPAVKEKNIELHNKRKGLLLLFFKTRIFPFTVIYFAIIVYVFINFLGDANWFWDSVLSLMNGKSSNIIIYSLILLLMLKLKIDPKMTIPIFIGISVLYFIIYKLVYYSSPSGIPTSLLKIINFAIAAFIMLYEFFYYKRKIFKPLCLSILISIFFYFSIVGAYTMIFRMTDKSSYKHVRSAIYLMRMGYSFPLDNIRETIMNLENKNIITTIIDYSVMYNKDLRAVNEEWEKIFLSMEIENVNVISKYLNNNNIYISYSEFISYVERQSYKLGSRLASYKNLINYGTVYLSGNMDDLLKRYNKQNVFYKLWFIKTIESANQKKYIPFLIDELTSIDDRLAGSAYEALKNITGKDYVKEKGLLRNSPGVINSYRKIFYY